MPPPEVVEQLREVDPRAELIYVGKGRWMLGTVRPHDNELHAQVVRAIGAYLLVLRLASMAAKSHVDGGPEVDLSRKGLAKLHYRLWFKRLQLQGFRKVYTFKPEEYGL